MSEKLLLDASSVVGAVGQPFVIPTSVVPVYFHCLFESTGTVFAEVKLGVSLREEDAGSVSIPVLDLLPAPKTTLVAGSAIASSGFPDAVKFDSLSSGLPPSVESIFYIEKCPHVIVPRVRGIVTGSYTGTWRLRLWAWQGS